MTGRLIDADALKEALNKSIVEAIQHGNNFSDAFKNDSQEWSAEIWTIEDKIDNAPTVDAEPVRHGYWIQLEFKSIWNNKLIACSKCGELFLVQHVESEHYCRNCGAKMDAQEKEE